MGDCRNTILKDLISSFHFLEQFMKIHMQCIDSEERGLRQSMDNWESAHRTFERLGNLQELQGLLNEYQRQQKKVQSTIKTFLELNQDLKGSKYYLEATELIQEQKALEGPNAQQMKDQPYGGIPQLAAAEREVQELDPQPSDQKLSQAE